MKQLIVRITVSLFLAGNMSAAQDKPAPTDPEIAMIVVTADNVDIDAGKLAATKSSNAKVKEFAQRYGLPLDPVPLPQPGHNRLIYGAARRKAPMPLLRSSS